VDKIHTVVVAGANPDVASTSGQLTTSVALTYSNRAVLLRKLLNISDRAMFERADAGFVMIK
jgi:hypothetical protein